MAVRGADRVAIDPLGGNPRAAATLQCVVETDHDGAVRDQAVDQQPQQTPRQLTARPGVAVEQTVIGGELRCLAQPHDPQSGGHRAASRGQDGTREQGEHLVLGARREHVPQPAHPGPQKHQDLWVHRSAPSQRCLRWQRCGGKRV